MRITRVYTGDDGRSHFEEIDLPIQSKAGGAETTKPLRVKNAVFRTATQEASKSVETLHASSKRLLVIKLTGRNEISVGDGTSRVFGPGSVHILDDTHGEGHRGHYLDEESITLMLDLED